jgi:membrane protease YdiL (CAAX protease family)
MADERWDSPMPSQGQQDDLLPVAKPVLIQARPCLDFPCPVETQSISRTRAILEIVAVFGLLFLVPSLVRSFFAEGSNNTPAFIESLGVYGRVVIMGSLTSLLVFMFLRRDREPVRAVGLHLKDLQGEVWAAFWSLVIIFAFNLSVMIVISMFLPDLATKLAKERTEVLKLFPTISPLWLILITAFVGFYEELVFRGFLITRLKAVAGNIWIAVFISSLIFGVAHSYQDSLAMVQITVIAFIFGTMFVLRKSLISPILAHMAFDFINLAFAFGMSKIPVKELERMLSS